MISCDLMRRVQNTFFETVQYTQTTHDLVARQFLNNHEKMLKMLLEE